MLPKRRYNLKAEVLLLLNEGGIFHGACRLYSCLYTPVWCTSVGLCLVYSVPCVSGTSLQNCYLRFLPILYICSHMGLSVTLVALSVKLYLVFVLFCFQIMNLFWWGLFFIPVQLPNVPSNSPNIVSSGNLISMLCFLTQIAIEISNGTEPRTDSCRTPSIHPFILTANPDNSLYSVF